MKSAQTHVGRHTPVAPVLEILSSLHLLRGFFQPLVTPKVHCDRVAGRFDFRS
jgi:hypothetical protein